MENAKASSLLKIPAAMLAIAGVHYVDEKFQLMQRVQERFFHVFSFSNQWKITQGIEICINFVSFELMNKIMPGKAIPNYMTIPLSFALQGLVANMKKMLLMKKLATLANDSENRRIEIERRLDDLTKTFPQRKKISGSHTEEIKREIHKFSETIDTWQTKPRYYELENPSLLDGVLFLNETCFSTSIFLDKKYNEYLSNSTEEQSIACFEDYIKKFPKSLGYLEQIKLLKEKLRDLYPPDFMEIIATGRDIIERHWSITKSLPIITTCKREEAINEIFHFISLQRGFSFQLTLREVFQQLDQLVYKTEIETWQDTILSCSPSEKEKIENAFCLLKINLNYCLMEKTLEKCFLKYLEICVQ